MRLCRRHLAAVLALLLVAPGPGALAANLANPAVARGSGSGRIMPLANLGRAPLNLSPKNRLPGLPLLTPGSTLPNAPRLSLMTATVMPGARALPLLDRPAAAKVYQIASQVNGIVTAAGPLDKAAPDKAKDMGDEAFQALIEDPAGAAGDVSLPPAEPNLTQRMMLDKLEDVAAIFSQDYAPAQWKKERFHVDFKREHDKVAAAILADPQITTQKFQDLLYDLAASMHDYHVSISFNSTESARLPFLVFGAGGKYLLAFIDRAQLPSEIFPFNVGDEVVSFDGKPTAEAVSAIAVEKGANTPETDLRLAEIFLTNRRRARGDHVPQGDVRFSIRGQDGELREVRMPWAYIPELIPQDVPVRDEGLLAPDSPEGLQPLAGLDDSMGAPQAGESLKSLIRRAFANAAHPLARFFAQMRAEAAGNPFLPGARESYVPKLGDILWQTKENDPFHAYIFKTPDGRKTGFIRIPSYQGGEKEAKRFGRIMAKFQKQTDALVIDQINNPGGSVFYLYALASHLTDKPLLAPKHQLVIDQNDGQWAADLLLQMIAQMGLQAAPSRLAGKKAQKEETADGYPITQKFMELMVEFAQFILKQLHEGKRFTDLTHLWGVKDIDPAPNPEERYTKPILLLTNALDFSGGDFFPAITQDNHRAVILGAGTAGAGGAVKPFTLPNQFGIADISATWTLARRAGGQPIENLRVMPDIPYEITEKDMRTGFSEYREKILMELARLLGPAQP